MLESLDELFGFGFRALGARSVWELGAGERRCLLLVSQALAGPKSWIMHSPLERLDGPRQYAIRCYMEQFIADGGLLVAGTRNPSDLVISSAAHLLVLGETANAILYQGSGADAGKEKADGV